MDIQIGQIYMRKAFGSHHLVIITRVNEWSIHFNNYPERNWPDSIDKDYFIKAYRRHVTDLDFYKDIIWISE